MTWAGTGVLWTLVGGVPASRMISSGDAKAAQTGFSFMQISDSHIGFNKPANPDAIGDAERRDRQGRGDDGSGPPL